MTLPQQVEPTDPALDEPMAHTSALRLTMASPLFRGATIAVFLSALGMSAAAPQIATFLVDDLHASLTAAGLFYLTNLAAPVAGFLVGRRSDHTGHRLGLFRLCAAAGFVGWLGIAHSTELWMPYVISATIGGVAGAATSQLFAAVHDELEAHPGPNNDGVVAVVRMALTGGWVIGPVAGSFLAAQTSLRTMLTATAICTLAQIVPLGALRKAPSATLKPDTAHPDTVQSDTVQSDTVQSDTAPAVRRAGPSLRAMLPLLAFTGLYILVYAGEPIKYAYLPIYMHQLHFQAGLSGAIIGIQPLVEIILMPVAVIVARRTGMTQLMIVGAAFSVAANICFAATDNPIGLFAGQILMGGVWGIFATLGIIVAQRLLPTAVATASAIFMSSPALSSALGGAAGGIGAAAIGLPHVFFIPAALALPAVSGLALMARSTTPDR